MAKPSSQVARLVADMIDDRVAIEDLAVRRDHGEAFAHDSFEAAELHSVGSRGDKPVDEEAMQVDDLGAGTRKKGGLAAHFFPALRL